MRESCIWSRRTLRILTNIFALSLFFLYFLFFRLLFIEVVAVKFNQEVMGSAVTSQRCLVVAEIKFNAFEPLDMTFGSNNLIFFEN